MEKFVSKIALAGIFFGLIILNSRSIAQAPDNVWVTFEDVDDLPSTQQGKPVSSNPIVQQLINDFVIYDISQALPDSRQEHLQRVYQLTCNCDVSELTAAIEERAAGTLTNPQWGVQYEILHDPDDYDAVFSDDYALDLIKAKGAWDYSTGDSNIILGISDGNYYLNHEDLEGQFVSYESPNNSSYYAHGTAVAVTAAGGTNNGVGKSSIGYDCRMNLVGISYNRLLILANAGARVINISWTSGCWVNSYIQEVINEVHSSGAICVAAAGNGSTCGSPTALVYPAACENVIAVTSVGPNDYHERFPGDSSSTHQHNNIVDICAPGYDVALTVAPGVYLTGNGTSFAAPLVTGTIGLMLSLRPCLTADDVLEILEVSSDDIYSINPQYSGQLGFGRLNAEAALMLTAGLSCNGSTPGGSTGSGTPNDTIPNDTIPNDASSDVLTLPNSNAEDMQSDSLTSVFNITQNEVLMYPNPTNGKVQLNWQGAATELRVFNTNGMVVYSRSLESAQREIEIDIAQNGVYVVQLQMEDTHRWSKKLIKL